MSRDPHIRQAARRFAARIALIDGARRWTFREFDEAVETAAVGLARFAPGSRVALFMSNRAEYLILQAAIERAGLVRVPLNARYTTHEVRTLLADCEASALFYDAQTADRAAEAAAKQAGLWTCAVDAEGGDDGLSWARLSGTTTVADGPESLDELCSITYTSGSSGRPKGVMLTRRNWWAVTKNMLIDRDVRGDDVVAHVGPLTHASGAYFAPFFVRGATNVIVRDGVEGLLRTIAEQRVTVFTCVPSLLTRIVRHPDVAAYDLSSLRWVGYGAEPISRNTLEKAIALFGPILTQNYGLTEAMMTCSRLQPEEHFLPARNGGARELRFGTIGRPYSFVEIVLRDPATGRPVAAGEVGEITIRAEHVMAGYWRRPEETAAALRDGWLWSGDLGRMDAEGFISLAGRTKEMLISGGFNIYPTELEACLSACAGVVEAAVIGVPDEDFGEIAVAYVAVEPEAPTDERALIEHCKPRLGIKTPKRWVLVDSLPKTSNGKIDKARLRAAPAGGA